MSAKHPTRPSTAADSKRARKRRNRDDPEAQSKEDPSAVLTVVLVPLNEKQIGRLGAHWGVVDVPKLLRALKQSNALELAGRPGDLQ
jgi:hypothetical protein